MRRHLLLPFLETIAWNAEFPSDLGRRTVAGIQKFNGLTLELRSEPSSLSHVAPPRGPHRAPF
jgi:hypothetical protein